MCSTSKGNIKKELETEKPKRVCQTKTKRRPKSAQGRKPAKRKKMGTRVRRREPPIAMRNRPNQAPRRRKKKKRVRRNAMQTIVSMCPRKKEAEQV
jgi:hypothetical protein